MSERDPVRMLGRYAVCDAIGSGGMATVHVGRLLGPVGFSRTVAIKRMHPHLAQDPEFVAMFLDEARVAARVQHANVVATLDCVTEGGELFLVMEYIDGEAFSRVLRSIGKKGGRLPLPVVGAVISQLCHGLHAVHEATGEDGRPLGLIHRDVSPDNVLIGRDGLARVLDFGIAKATEHGRRTQAGKIKGKVMYMSPEHVRAKDLDRRADVYAVAAVLWEALTGRNLIPGGTDLEQMQAVLKHELSAPSTIVSSLPPEIDALVMKGLATNRDDRFATAREMGIAVERTLGLASPTSVGQLVEGMLGAELAKRAAIVDRAMRSTFEFQSSGKIQPSSDSAKNLLISVPTPNASQFAPLSPDPPPVAASPAARPRDAVKEAALRVEGPFAPLPAGEKKSAEGTAQGDAAATGTKPRVPPKFAHTAAFGSDPDLPIPPAAKSHGTLAFGVTRPSANGLENPPERAANIEVLDFGANPTPAEISKPRVELPNLPALELPDLGVAAPHAAPVGRVALPAPPQAPDKASAEEPKAAPKGLSVDFGSASPPLPVPAPPLPMHSASPQAAAPAWQPARPEPSRALSQRSVDGRSRPSSRAPAPPPEEPSTKLSASVLVPVALTLVGVVLVVAFLFFKRRSERDRAEASAKAIPAIEDRAACETLRKRVKAGDQPVGLSRQGWVIELWLRGASGAAIDTGSVDLENLRGSDPKSKAELGELKALRGGSNEGTLVTLSGPVAERVFLEEEALRLIKAADLTFETSKAEVGALTMRCAHLPYHDIGLWFRGRNIVSASAAVLFSIGTFADFPIVLEGALEPPEAKGPTLFDRTRDRLTKSRATDLDLEVQKRGGTVDTIPGRGDTRITFHSDHLAESLRFSRIVADKAGVEAR